MCWACYTPLTGGAAAAAPAGMAPKTGGKASAQDGGDSEKKGLGALGAIPPWQLGVLGVGLLLVIGFVVMHFMGGGSSDDDDGTTNGNSTTTKKTDPVAVAPGPGGPSAPASSSGSGSGGGGSVPTVGDVPFVMVSSPNPRTAVATMAIMPRNPPVSSAQAKGVAAFARRQILDVKHYSDVYIYVINDSQSAQTFREYQAKRHQDPLNSQDYQNLSTIWGNVPARYYYHPQDGHESVV